MSDTRYKDFETTCILRTPITFLDKMMYKYRVSNPCLGEIRVIGTFLKPKEEPQKKHIVRVWNCGKLLGTFNIYNASGINSFYTNVIQIAGHDRILIMYSEKELCHYPQKIFMQSCKKRELTEVEVKYI